MMKRYFSLVNILLIAGLCYFGVTAFYRYVTARLAHPPLLEVPETAMASATDAVERPLSEYQPIVERNLFKTKEQATVEAPAPEEEAGVDVDALQPTELNLKLWGTVSGDRERTYAVIEDAKERKQNLFREGDTVQNARVKKILREKVILNVDGEDEILEMEKRLASASRGRPAPAGPAKQRAASLFPSTDGPAQNIRLERAEIQEAVNNVNNLMRQARIRPHFRDGKPDGLTLTRVRPNSIFTKLGLRSGDIITGVDGENIQSVDDALRFYRNLKSSSNVKIDVRRRGQPLSIDYTIE